LKKSSRPGGIAATATSQAAAGRSKNAPGRVGIVDIGSNTVRLVVYDAPLRLPVPIYNEKTSCRLAKGLETTGRLNPQGVEEAIRSLHRFTRLADAMGVERLDLVATAAVRDASDGRRFVKRIKKTFKMPVNLLSGPEEARMAALGLLSGVRDADGMLADLGGGSLDLVKLDKGKFADFATVPLGHLRLSEAAHSRPDEAADVVAKRLADVPWLGTVKGRTFYGVGGAWRTLARVFIDQTGYPLHVVDGFRLSADAAWRLAHLVGHLGAQSLARIPGVPRARAETLPYAALVLEYLLAASRARDIVFSSFGMREGRLLETLPEKVRRQDPLIAGATGMAERTGRFPVDADGIMAWLKPILADGKDGGRDDERRLALAATLLSDIGWDEHPDYRAEHAYLRALRLPFAGLSHADRVFIALAIFIRYNGEPANRLVAPVKRMLDDERRMRARSIGLALRLAHTLTGSAPGLLERTRLVVKGKWLTLKIPAEGQMFQSETIERRLRTLARSLGLKGKIG